MKSGSANNNFNVRDGSLWTNGCHNMDFQHIEYTKPMKGANAPAAAHTPSMTCQLLKIATVVITITANDSDEHTFDTALVPEPWSNKRTAFFND